MVRRMVVLLPWIWMCLACGGARTSPKSTVADPTPSDVVDDPDEGLPSVKLPRKPPVGSSTGGLGVPAPASFDWPNDPVPTDDASEKILKALITRIFESYATTPLSIEKIAGVQLRRALDNGQLSADPFLNAQDFQDVAVTRIDPTGPRSAEVTFTNFGRPVEGFISFDQRWGVRDVYYGEDWDSKLLDVLKASTRTAPLVEGTLCFEAESQVAWCELPKSQRVSVCRNDATRQLQYRRGSADNIRRSLPARGTPSVSVSRYEALPETNWVVVTADDRNSVETLAISESEGEVNGTVVVRKDGEVRMEVVCQRASSGQRLFEASVDPSAPFGWAGDWSMRDSSLHVSGGLSTIGVAVGDAPLDLTFERFAKGFRAKTDACTLVLMPRARKMTVRATGTCPIASGTYLRR